MSWNIRDEGVPLLKLQDFARKRGYDTLRIGYAFGYEPKLITLGEEWYDGAEEYALSAIKSYKEAAKKGTLDYIHGGRLRRLWVKFREKCDF